MSSNLVRRVRFASALISRSRLPFNSSAVSWVRLERGPMSVIGLPLKSNLVRFCRFDSAPISSIQLLSAASTVRLPRLASGRISTIPQPCKFNLVRLVRLASAARSSMKLLDRFQVGEFGHTGERTNVAKRIETEIQHFEPHHTAERRDVFNPV